MTTMHPLPATSLPTDPEVRRQQAAALARSVTAADLPMLLAFLSDEHWRVRKAAVAAFRQMPASQGVPVLLASLSDESNAGLRNSALEALHEYGEAGLPHIHRALRDADPDVHIALLGLLGRLAHPESVPYILFYLGSPHRNIAAASIAALGEIRDPAAAGVLLKLLDRADDWLAVHVVEALGEIGDAAALPALTLRAEKAGPLRRTAIAALGRIGGEGAIDPLLRALQGEKFTPEAAAALVAIHERLSARPTSVPRARALRARIKAEWPAAHAAGLLHSLGRASGQSRAYLSRLAVWLKNPELLSPLFNQLEPGDLGAAEIQTLAQMPEAGPALAAAFRDCQALERQAVLAQLLGRLGVGDAAPDLLAALVSEDPYLRESLIEALGNCGGPSIVMPLIDLATEDFGSLEGVTEALRRLTARDPASMAAFAARFEEMLGGADPATRLVAIRLGTTLRPDLLAPHLKRLTRENRPALRTAALEAATPADLSADELRLLLLDEAPAVRRQALRLLRLAGLAPEDLERALNDPDLWVQSDAAAALAAAGGAGAAQGINRLASWPEPVAAAFLDALPTPEVEHHLDALLAAARGPLTEIARGAVGALARARAPAALPFLREWLESPQPARVLAALQLCASPAYLELGGDIVRLLERKPDPVVAIQTLGTLGQMSSPAAIASAIRLLDSDPLSQAALVYLTRMKALEPGSIRRSATTASPRCQSLVRELLGDSA